MVNLKNQDLVEELLKLLNSHKNFALVSYEKITHQSLESLRRELKKADAQLKVVKNSLLEKAVNKISQSNDSFKNLKKQFFPLKTTSALLTLSENWSQGLKAFANFADKDKNLYFKMALLDATIYPRDETEKIAKLPSKNELMATILGSMKSPMTHSVYALKYSLNKFVYILKEKSKTK